MRPVTIYTTRYCSYCTRAKHLLRNKDIGYAEIAVDGNPALRQEMITRSGSYTVPQIWVGETHVGGCDDLMQLEYGGQLDTLLAS